jgi:hypothetical protein
MKPTQQLKRLLSKRLLSTLQTSLVRLVVEAVSVTLTRIATVTVTLKRASS